MVDGSSLPSAQSPAKKKKEKNNQKEMIEVELPDSVVRNNKMQNDP